MQNCEKLISENNTVNDAVSKSTNVVKVYLLCFYVSQGTSLHAN